jgi:hypothetical protein
LNDNLSLAIRERNQKKSYVEDGIPTHLFFNSSSIH